MPLSRTFALKQLVRGCCVLYIAEFFWAFIEQKTLLTLNKNKLNVAGLRGRRAARWAYMFDRAKRVYPG